MSRRRVIAVIVGVATAIAAGFAAAAAALAGRAGLHAPVRTWVWIGIAFDAVILYATFERRAAMWGAIVSRGRPRAPAVAITFDDGPTEPYTSQVLDVLRDFQVRATFFVLGARVQSIPDVVRRAAREGHEIGNHSWDHAALPLRTPDAIRATIRRTSDLVEHITGERPRVFRAPFGWRNPWLDSAARREGCEPIAWTVGVYDTDRPGVETIVNRAIRGLRNGSILLLHDGRSLDPNSDASQVVAALPRILSELRRRGFRVLTISELLAETNPSEINRRREKTAAPARPGGRPRGDWSGHRPI